MFSKKATTPNPVILEKPDLKFVTDFEKLNGKKINYLDPSDQRLKDILNHQKDWSPCDTLDAKQVHFSFSFFSEEGRITELFLTQYEGNCKIPPSISNLTCLKSLIIYGDFSF